MKGIPIFFHTSDDVSSALATKKTSTPQGPINLEGIFENYKITANKSLTFTDFFGRRTIHLQGKVVTVVIPGQIYNCDEDCFAFTEDTTKNAINTMLSVKNAAPIFSKLSFFYAKGMGSLKKRAFLLDLAYIHS